MPSVTRQQVTRMLVDWSAGNREAAVQLMPLVYDELRNIARGYLRRERPDHTLQATGLVHEAYLRLIDQDVATWENRAHFFGVAASVMRRILVDHARRAGAGKRGGGWDKLELNEALLASPERSVDLIALDDALQSLAEIDSRKSHLVELRFFGGLTVEEAGEVLEVSPSTVKREWRIAKAWLRRDMLRGGEAINAE